WSDHDVSILLNHFSKNTSQMADASNFKDTVYNAAVNLFIPLLSAGAFKSSAVITRKWTSLKQTYNAILTYQDKSGCHWDNVHGAGI
ncbi:hypothetical protein HYDPIDRAFT_52170, partial [Hydnomerulius pinastri MD-312]